jgi:hypothetical protein
MARAKYAFLALVLIAFAGCNRPAQETATQQQDAAAVEPMTTPPQQSPAPEENATQTAAPPSPAVPEPAKAPAKATAVKPTTKAAPAASAHPSRTEPETASSGLAPAAGSRSPAAASKPVEPKYATIDSGVTLPVRLQTPLDTAINKSGDTFSAVLDKDIIVDGNVVAPRGSAVEGKLSHVERAGRVEGRAAMSLQLTSLEIGDKTYALQTDILAVQAESTKKQDATKVGIGAGLGAVIGAIAGGGKGAAIGAAVGAGAGGATVVATRGKEVKFDVEQKLNFVLREGVRIRLQ